MNTIKAALFVFVILAPQAMAVHQVIPLLDGLAHQVRR